MPSGKPTLDVADPLWRGEDPNTVSPLLKNGAVLTSLSFYVIMTAWHW
jgi:hypothetical protein